jgi:putative redox protein
MSTTEDVMAGRSVATSDAGYRTDVRAGHHHLVADEPEARGGTDEGASPTQLLAGALASCTAITLRMYGERKGWDLGPIKVDCRVFYRGGDRKHQGIDRTVTIGASLTDEQRAKIAKIADKTPVTIAVSGATAVTTTIK